MNFTQEQLDTIQLPIRGKRIKLEVLNTDFQTLATLEGNTTGGSLQKDATNFVRRSGSIQMCVPNIASAETFLDYIEGVTINVNGKIWLDKYIKIWVGIENYVQPYGKAPKTVWYNFGICLIDQPVRTFGSDGYTMNFNVIDLSAKMNGERSGQLAVTTTLYPRVQSYGTGFSEVISNPFATYRIPINAITADDEYVYLVSYGVNLAYAKRSTMSFRTATTSPVYSINCVVNNDKSVLCGGVGGSMSIFDKNTKTFSSTIDTPFVPSSQSSILAMVANGASIYLGGEYGCFSIYNEYESTFTPLIDNPFKENGNAIYSMCISGDGTVFCGGANKYFYYYKDGAFNTTEATNNPFGSHERISSMVCHGDKIYCGGGNGTFAVYDIKTKTFGDSIANPFDDSTINALEEYGGQIYCCGSDGKFCTYNLADGTFSSLMETPFGANESIRCIWRQGDTLYLGGGKRSGSYTSVFCEYGLTYYTETEQAIASCIGELTEFKRYTIYPVPEKWKYLPYDIKMGVGSTVYTALEQFLNILSGWQMYFDNDGVFVVEPIPSGANDIVYPLNLQLNTQDVNSVDFNNVRNQVIVYGRSHNIDFYSDSKTWTFQGELQLNFETLDTNKIQVGSTIFGWSNGVYEAGGIVYGSYLHDISIVVNGTPLFSNAPICWYGTNDVGCLIEEGIYVFRVKEAFVVEQEDTQGNTIQVIDFTQPITFELLGFQQTQACIVNANNESPYSILKNYNGKAHFGVLSTYSIVQSDFRLDVELDDDWDNPQVGEILAMYIRPTAEIDGGIANIYNKSSGELSFTATINLNGKEIGGDYTIWEFRYTGTSLDLIGRCPYANTLVESGGVYDNIYADILARERAEYDLFLHTNMQNTVTLSCVPDYSIDVNYRIKYNQSSALPPDAVVDETFEDKYFITKQVSYPLGMDGSTQTINAIEIYDDYNYVGYAYDLPTTS